MGTQVLSLLPCASTVARYHIKEETSGGPERPRRKQTPLWKRSQEKRIWASASLRREKRTFMLITTQKTIQIVRIARTARGKGQGSFLGRNHPSELRKLLNH